MNPILLILYFLGMVLVPIMRLRPESADRRTFLLLYLVAVLIMAIVSPHPLLPTLAILYLPVLIASIIGDMTRGTWFRVLYLFINILILGRIISLGLYAKTSIVFILILLTIFLLLSKEKRRFRR